MYLFYLSFALVAPTVEPSRLGIIGDAWRKEAEPFVKMESDLAFFFCVVRLSAAGAGGVEPGGLSSSSAGAPRVNGSTRHQQAASHLQGGE